jgi:UDP-N-acetylglucosamine transferase subunit ALG13
MILVTVGTHEQPFDRLIKEVDKLVGKGKLKDVIVQTGYSNYQPKNIKTAFKFIEFQKMNNFFRKAKIVITHAGIGSTLLAIRYGKPTIVVPRYKEFGEHLTHHQLDVTRELEREGKIIAVYDIRDLENAIDKAKNWKIKPIEKGKVFDIIRDFLSKIN